MSDKAKICNNCKYWRDIHQTRVFKSDNYRYSVGYCQGNFWPSHGDPNPSTGACSTFYNFGCCHFDELIKPPALAEKLTLSVMDGLGWESTAVGYDSTLKLILKAVQAVLEKEPKP